MSHRLAQLHASLAIEAAAGRLILTGALLDADHLADQWLVLFGTKSLTLHDAVVVDYDDGGRITVHGSTELLGRGRRSATLILLEASDRFGAMKTRSNMC